MASFPRKKRPPFEIKIFNFDNKSIPLPDTKTERSEKDDLIEQWLKKNQIKKLPYRPPWS